MRKLILFAAVLFVMAPVAAAQAIKLTALDQGYYVVSVNEMDVSRHTTEREAIEASANRELAAPADVVEYRHDYRVKVEATAPGPVSPPVIVPGADVLWRWNADSIAPFGIHAKDPGRVTLVQVGGRNAVRLLTLPGDSNLFGSGAWERCDLRLSNELTDAHEGSKQRWTHYVWLGDDYADLPQSPANAQPWYGGLLMNFHNSADKGGQANAQLMAMPPTATSPDRPIGLHFQIHGGNPANPTVGQYPIGPIVRNVWLKFDYEVLWTSQLSGYFNGWLNGKQFMAHKGPTLYTGQAAYLKLANYHSAIGTPSAVHHGPVIRW